MAGERREELLELAYAYVRSHGITELSLRPLAASIGSSPRVLLFLFGSKDGLVRALLDRARADELALLRGLPPGAGLAEAGVPGADVPGADVPGADVPGADVPGADVPAADAPGAGVSGAGVPAAGLPAVTEAVWEWLSDEAHRPLLRLWLEAYARSLVDPAGPWSAFAAGTVADWLTVLAGAQPAASRDTPDAVARRTAALAILRGALLDLLATGDTARTTAAVRLQVESL